MTAKRMASMLLGISVAVNCVESGRSLRTGTWGQCRSVKWNTVLEALA